MRRRRIWSEMLPASELGAPSTVALLARYDLEPIVALPPSHETPAMSAALARLHDGGVRVGIWPLLDDSDGYWPSIANADRFERRVLAAIDFAEKSGAPPRTVAIDLEPPLEITRALMNGPRRRTLYAETRLALSAEGRELRKRALARFSAIQQMLRTRGIESLAAVLPFVLFDFSTRVPVFQQLFGTPVTHAGWDVVSPMVYSSIIAEVLPGHDLDGARGVLYESARLLQRFGPGRSSMSLGLIGTGKLGNEPALPDPRALQLDVSAARAAGVEDLALFSLEGLLRHGAPEPWLNAFSDADKVVPERRRSARWASRMLAWGPGQKRPR